MELAVDLHAHSSYAGGTGSITLEQVDNTVPLKGIDVIGTGDAQFPIWNLTLRKKLQEREDGIFELKNGSKTSFILQTEVIFTTKIGDRTKQVHVVILFPSFEAIDSFYSLLMKWNVAAEKVGRPFITCESIEEVNHRVNKIFDIDPFIEFIPAHVMTPVGIYGSNTRVNRLKDFFGASADRIKIVETGLSADPLMLGMIPELDSKTLISNSDAHSMHLHRIGREFTVIDVVKPTYQHVIKALRERKIQSSAEFHPTEGRFFLTGHAKGRYKPKTIKANHKKTWHENDEYCCFSPKFVPKHDICPICGRKLTIGALQRLFEICSAQGEVRNFEKINSKQNFIHMVPLIEIIATTMGIKTLTSKRVIKEYHNVINLVKTEVNLWKSDINTVKEILTKNVSMKLLTNIIEIKKGNFCYRPLGYDGTYGTLVIGETIDIMEINEIEKQEKTKKSSLTDFFD
jgi:PHP family Zn ribbon phosphoesterase